MSRSAPKLITPHPCQRWMEWKGGENFGLEYYDKPIVQKIAAALESDPKFSTLIREVVQSVPFQMRRGEGDHRKFAAPAQTASAK